jgi:E3 ubiquitin-protein ligase HUWE1
MWNEFESDDLLQMLLHRNRISQREETIPEPVFARTFPESNENLLNLSAYYSGLAVDEALLEEAKEEPRQEELKERLEEEKVEAQLRELENLAENAENIQENLENLENPENLAENLEVRENSPPRNYALPEGIDLAILEELPEDIRNEVLSQYQRPPREEGVNEEFLQAMPADIRNELLMQQRAPARPAQDVDNATFIATLTPELRREVLLGASEEFLNTLPPDLVAEARALQDRYVGRDYLQGRQQAVRKKQVQEEDKTISTISNEEKLAASLTVAEDSFLEVLLKILYLSTPVNRDILNSLLVDLSAQPVNRSKIIDSLISLLTINESKGQLPPGHLFGSESYLENFNKVFAITSIRVLDVLHQLAASNSKVSQDLVSVCKFRLPHIKAIKPEETFGFQDLISLMDQSLFRTSTSHLTPLIALLSSVVQKLDNRIPSLNQVTVDRICSLLSFESLNETTVKSVVEIVTKLSATEINKEQVVQALKHQLVLIAREVLALLEEAKTSSNGLKEVQLLRICKVISGVCPLSDEIDFLWGPLSVFLTHIIGQESQLASTANPLLTRILPLIECLLIAHYGRTNSAMFEKFTETHSKLLNLIIRQNPNLLYETFSSLVTKFPYLLDFENKRVYFKAELRNMRRDRGYDNISLRVRRHEVFMDSFHQLKNKTPPEMHGKLRVTIAGEEGLDAGGVTREWYSLLAREMFNVDYALFKLSANGVSFQPNPNSSINSEHIQFFKFVGRIIGKALCDSQALDVYFTRSFYKHILGQEVTYQDMEDLDVDFYKSLKFLMEINLDDSDLHEYYFSYEEEEFGILKVKELVPNGKTRRVSEADKMDYIKLLCAAKMTKNIQAQIEAFKTGFHEMVPAKIVSIFDSKELELLISGLPTVDLEDLKANTEYHNFTKDSEVIKWFWEVMENFSREERAEFIQFVTGSSKVPIEGFKALPGIGGYQKFQIHKSFASTDRLPTAHTCMNQLDLPEYPSKEHLRHLLKLAITEGKEGFGFV